ncbi:hypothetical protein PR048_028970 [Dryococelus australis]|uniref:Uncharacterized protein n=1 Tax=Dryococelus australis TaxID=614101 RepID=A0ABQ9GC21_9NEOP|nr:hypothetical protein PR048_028970 [Dryococelus australis]
MRVIEVSTEQRQNEGAGVTGDPRENPPTSGIIHISVERFQTPTGKLRSAIWLALCAKSLRFKQVFLWPEGRHTLHPPRCICAPITRLRPRRPGFDSRWGRPRISHAGIMPGDVAGWRVTPNFKYPAWAGLAPRRRLLARDADVATVTRTCGRPGQRARANPLRALICLWHPAAGSDPSLAASHKHTQVHTSLWHTSGACRCQPRDYNNREPSDKAYTYVHRDELARWFFDFGHAHPLIGYARLWELAWCLIGYFVLRKVSYWLGCSLASRLPGADRSERRYPIKSSARSLDFRMWESCRTMPLVGRFSQEPAVSPPFPSGAAPFSPQSLLPALKTSLLIATQTSSLTHTHLLQSYVDCKIPTVDDVGGGGWQKTMVSDVWPPAAGPNRPETAQEIPRGGVSSPAIGGPSWYCGAGMWGRRGGPLASCVRALLRLRGTWRCRQLRVFAFVSSLPPTSLSRSSSSAPGCLSSKARFSLRNQACGSCFHVIVLGRSLAVRCTTGLECDWHLRLAEGSLLLGLHAGKLDFMGLIGQRHSSAYWSLRCVFIGCCPTPGSYGIRKAFPCKSAIGSEASRVGLINCDPIAKCWRRPGGGGGAGEIAKRALGRTRVEIRTSQAPGADRKGNVKSNAEVFYCVRSFSRYTEAKQLLIPRTTAVHASKMASLTSDTSGHGWPVRA